MASNSDGLELVARQVCALTDMVGYIERTKTSILRSTIIIHHRPRKSTSCGRIIAVIKTHNRLHEHQIYRNKVEFINTSIDSLVFKVSQHFPSRVGCIAMPQELGLNQASIISAEWALLPC